MSIVYKCMDCGEQFKEPAELSPEEYAAAMKDTPFEYLTLNCCPACHGTDIMGGESCIACGERQKEPGRELCAECQMKFDRLMSHMVGEIQTKVACSYREAIDLMEDWLSRHW